jgi:predicted metal-dependent hydrolase
MVLHAADAVRVEGSKAAVDAWTRRIMVTVREVHDRPLTRTWASCSSRGRLTFATDLLRQLAVFRAEVILRELRHLKVPSHGRVFQALLKAYLTLDGRGEHKYAVVD